MSFQNCPKCGKLFNGSDQKICDECKKKEEEKFEEVRLFVKENPDLNMVEIAKGTGVTVSKILGYVRAGRIEMSLKSGDSVSCEKCGKEILTGKFCKDCAERLSDSVMGKMEQDRISKAARNNARMFTRD